MPFLECRHHGRLLQEASWWEGRPACQPCCPERAEQALLWRGSRNGTSARLAEQTKPPPAPVASRSCLGTRAFRNTEVSHRGWRPKLSGQFQSVTGMGAVVAWGFLFSQRHHKYFNNLAYLPNNTRKTCECWQLMCKTCSSLRKIWISSCSTN